MSPKKVVVLFAVICCFGSSQLFAITITAPPAGALPEAVIALPYNGGAGVQFQCDYGGQKSWTIDASSPDLLPSGLTLTAGTGLLNGTPAIGTDGIYTIVVRVACSGACIFPPPPPDTETYTLTVSNGEPIQITTSALDDGIYGQAYSFQVDTTGGVGALDFSNTSGLPNGLSIGQTTGLISGTLDADAYLFAPYSVTLDVEDSNIPPTTHSVTLDLDVPAPELKILTSALPAGEIGTTYTTTTLSANGGVPAYSWTVTGLPNGLSVTGGGVISGMPLAGTEGVHQINLSVTDNDLPSSQSDTTIITLSISAAGTNPLTITTSNLNVAEEEEAYSPVILTAAGGTSPYTWSAVGLPNGLELDGDVISGEPLEGTAGTYYVNTVVTDFTGDQASAMLMLIVEDPDGASSSGSSLPVGSSINLVGGGGSCTIYHGQGFSWWYQAMGMLGLAILFCVRNMRTAQ
ncbi:MAG: putative Ig domain-containing protein [Planctomycetaceae bacterium]|nr:putative Ig domain-containing protein [Planctomycetaceae bacterium]